MAAYHTPKAPTIAALGVMTDLIVDVDKGLIYDRKGKELGWLDASVGYHKVNIKGRQFRRHHIVWWKKTGKWPETVIDHKNRNRADDRFDNLEALSQGANMLNSARSAERDLPPGVYRHRRSKKRPYQAKILSLIHI